MSSDPWQRWRMRWELSVLNHGRSTRSTRPLSQTNSSPTWSTRPLGNSSLSLLRLTSHEIHQVSYPFIVERLTFLRSSTFHLQHETQANVCLTNYEIIAIISLPWIQQTLPNNQVMTCPPESQSETLKTFGAKLQPKCV